jgi:hypothetical protein
MANFSAKSAVAADPDFGPNVLVFDPSTPNLQQRVDDIFRQQETNQFGPQRYSLLFKPGTYDAFVQVGFYTQVLGLGINPDDVLIKGAIQSTAGWMQGNATCNFWRSAENLSIDPVRDQRQVNTWAVSQGADLRRLHVQGNLKLWDGGWSSGGFLSDCKIDGWTESGSQQQWFSRNSDVGQWRGGVWNIVFVGCDGQIDDTWPDPPHTIVDQAPVSREKPFLTIDKSGNYSVFVPALHAGASRGGTWMNGQTPGGFIPIDDFLIAHPDRDTAETMNAALAAGKDLILTPGIYHVDAPIHVTRRGAIVLGMGYATLIPDRGTPAIVVDDIDGVSIGGLILDAGEQNSPELLRIGEPGSSKSHAANPTFLYDIVCRCGGESAGKTTNFVTINSHDTVGDNLWLWRADHGAGAAWDTNPVEHGLVVNGDDVTCYGLFVEHCQGYQTLWNGNGGKVYFYQSEMPYDPPSQESWSHDGVNGFASYKVADLVKTHQAWGLGIYSYFTAAPVVADASIEAPGAAGVQFNHMVTIRLGGQEGSGISHILNQRGDAVVGSNYMRANLE